MQPMALGRRMRADLAILYDSWHAGPQATCRIKQLGARHSETGKALGCQGNLSEAKTDPEVGHFVLGNGHELFAGALIPAGASAE